MREHEGGRASDVGMNLRKKEGGKEGRKESKLEEEFIIACVIV